MKTGVEASLSALPQSDAVTTDSGSSDEEHQSQIGYGIAPTASDPSRKQDRASMPASSATCSVFQAAPSKNAKRSKRRSSGVLLTLGVVAVALGFVAAAFAVWGWNSASITKVSQLALEQTAHQEQLRGFVRTLQSVQARVIVEKHMAREKPLTPNPYATKYQILLGHKVPNLAQEHEAVQSAYLNPTQVPAIVFVDINSRLSKDNVDAIAAGLSLCRSLKTLRIKHGNLGDEGAAAIAAAIAEPNLQALEHLALPNNRIGDEGAEHLGRAIQHHKSLKHLSVSDNRMTYDALRGLSWKVLTVPKIESLFLDGNVWRTPDMLFPERSGWWLFGWSGSHAMERLADILLSRLPHLRLRLRSTCFLCMDSLYSEQSLA